MTLQEISYYLCIQKTHTIKYCHLKANKIINPYIYIRYDDNSILIYNLTKKQVYSLDVLFSHQSVNIHILEQLSIISSLLLQTICHTINHMCHFIDEIIE